MRRGGIGVGLFGRPCPCSERRNYRGQHAAVRYTQAVVSHTGYRAFAERQGKARPSKSATCWLCRTTARTRCELGALKLDAESKVEIEAAQVAAKAKSVELDRVKKIYDSGGGNDWEYDKAQYEYDHAKLEIENAQLQAELKKCKAQKQAIQVEQMRLTSPIDGVVQKNRCQGGRWRPSRPTGRRLSSSRTTRCGLSFTSPAALAQHVATGQVLKVSYDSQAWETGNGDLS